MVVGLLVLVLGGSAFYFIRADRYGVLSQSISGTRADVISERVSEVSGDYTCSSSNGCQDSTSLTLNEDGTFNLTTTYQDGAETLAEKGRWFISGKGKGITLNVSGNQNEDYQTSKKIVVNQITVAALSKLAFSKEDYSNMENPMFWKAQ